MAISFTEVDPHVATLLGMTLGLSRHCEGHKARGNLCFVTEVDPHVATLLGMTLGLYHRHQITPRWIQHTYQQLLTSPRPTFNLLLTCDRRHHRWMLLDIHYDLQIVAPCKLRTYAVTVFEYPLLDICSNTRVQDCSIYVSQYVYTRFHLNFIFSARGRSPRRYAPRDDAWSIPSLRGPQPAAIFNPSLRGKLALYGP